MKLTPKQEAFIREYMVDLNATQAAIRAGYSAKTANRIGQENLTKPVILDAIKQKMDKRAEKVDLSAEWILQRLMLVAERSMQAEPVMIFDHESGTMVESGEYQFDSSGANKSLELLGKHIGLFDPKHKRVAELTETQIEQIKANIELTKARTGLIKGATKDTKLLEALIGVVNGD